MAVILSGARSAKSKDLLFQLAIDLAVILTTEGRKNLSDACIVGILHSA